MDGGKVKSLHRCIERWFRCKTTGMSALNDELLRAVDLAINEKWDAAHQVVQQYEEDALASWIHAALHKIEGDLGNSRYWYQRANRLDRVDEDPRTELAEIRRELLPRSSS